MLELKKNFSLLNISNYKKTFLGNIQYATINRMAETIFFGDKLKVKADCVYMKAGIYKLTKIETALDEIPKNIIF